MTMVHSNAQLLSLLALSFCFLCVSGQCCVYNSFFVACCSNAITSFSSPPLSVLSSFSSFHFLLFLSSRFSLSPLLLSSPSLSIPLRLFPFTTTSLYLLLSFSSCSYFHLLSLISPYSPLPSFPSCLSLKLSVLCG